MPSFSEKTLDGCCGVKLLFRFGDDAGYKNAPVEETRKQLKSSLLDADAENRGITLVNVSTPQKKWLVPLLEEFNFEHLHDFYNPRTRRNISMYIRTRPKPKVTSSTTVSW